MYHKPKVSIIIPCYNSAQFLQKAVDSALTQSVNEIEIILIDDGSTDKTPTLLQHYKMSDNRVEVITHIKNLGLGAARNSGIDMANGEYIFFLDSDDYMHQNALEVLYEKASDEDLDILQAQHIKHEETKQSVCPQNLIPFTRAISGIDYFNEGIKIEPKACAKLWKTSFLIKNNLRFDDGYYEDTAMVFYAFSIAKRVNNALFSCYHYIIREDSISNGKPSKKHVIDYKNSIIKLQQLFINQQITQKSSSFTASFALYLANLSAMALETHDYDLQKDIDKFVKQMSKKYRKYIIGTRRLLWIKRLFIAYNPFLYVKLKKVFLR